MKRLSAYLLLSFFSEADFEEREELEELELPEADFDILLLLPQAGEAQFWEVKNNTVSER